jgi:glutamate dehydrogenase
LRRDDFERFISCLVYIPRESYTTALRLRLQDILASAFGGQLASHSAELGDMPLARLHLLIQTTPGKITPYDERALEAYLAEEARTWPDRISEAAIEAHGEAHSERLADRYADAFPAAYRERFTARDTLFDIKVMDVLGGDRNLDLDLYRPEGMARNELRFKMYQVDREAALSDVLPVLEHMGLRVVDEIPFEISPQGVGPARVMIHDFGLETRDKADVVLHEVADKFKVTFERVWAGSVESDGFNALVLKAGLAWHEVVVLRAYSKYLRQISLPFSQTYMEGTLARNASLTRLLIDLFVARFDPAQPAKGRDASVKRLHTKIISGLDAVVSADEDRIIRAFLNLLDATLRTNYFQKDAAGADKAHVSFKLESRKIDDMPLPEIFVYSPRVEGIHLRFGFVARGGLRWSDRREDFRTEILGLVKAQQVKNAVIVPFGSKGGFVVKQPPVGGDRDAFLQEGIACYQTFISGLLDITDSYRGTKVIAPKDVVRHDADDPYLVVAADKGTATFSDIANGVSKDYGFWLGDAFASGGSVGYDHKKMGITARGAWESLKRHFREKGLNTQEEEFTVIGVGDMSGDVFGNGMPLSPHIKLVAAFNHLHIFVDPDPDPASSFAERARLFALPRSGWNDYNSKLISKGGAIFERSAKSITLTPEIRARFDITQTTLSPNEFLRILLKAQIDLLWFGGIGTYIKASSENNTDAGDRANDVIRINGNEVRAGVLGEGANLGITQPGRIECGLHGVRLNQDSIDNSAGVDCSDHEVNIKILIDSLVTEGKLPAKQRVGLLAQMTDEVGDLCLVDNYLQSRAISISQHQGIAALDNHIRLIRMLERGGDLDRAVEFLPDDETLAERQQKALGLSRPEIGVLLSCSKNWLYAQLLLSDLPDDPALEIELVEYFPGVLGKRYRAAIDRHRLRREIIATVVTNTLVNRVGETFVTEMRERTAMAAAQIVRAFSIARNVFAMDELCSVVEGLDNKVPAGVQLDMLVEINNLLDWITLWFLRNGAPGLAIGAHSERFRSGIGEIMEKLDEALPDHYLRDRETRAQRYIDKGVPKAAALRISGLVNLFSACDIVALAAARKLPVTLVAKIYFGVGTRFRLGSLRGAAEGLKADTHWQKIAISALIEETYGHQLVLSTSVLDSAQGKVLPAKAIEQWIERNQGVVEQTDRLLADL